mgnify:CR=1 FL=1
MIRASTRKHRLLIEQRVTTKDSYGGQSETWSTVATVWANIRPLSGVALETAQQTYGKVSHTIEINYRAGLTQANRGVFNGRYFDRSTADIQKLCRHRQILCGSI